MDMNDIVLCATAAILSVTGLCFLFLPGWLERRRERRCNYGVYAEIVHMELEDILRRGGKAENTYWVTFRYAVSGAEHTARYGKELKGKGRKPGDRVLIYINPDKPEDIFIPGEADRNVRICMTFMGCVLLLGSIQCWLEAFRIIG